jgi:hypothetical protein
MLEKIVSRVAAFRLGPEFHLLTAFPAVQSAVNRKIDRVGGRRTIALLRQRLRVLLRAPAGRGHKGEAVHPVARCWRLAWSGGMSPSCSHVRRL